MLRNAHSELPIMFINLFLFRYLLFVHNDTHTKINITVRCLLNTQSTKVGVVWFPLRQRFGAMKSFLGLTCKVQLL